MRKKILQTSTGSTPANAMKTTLSFPPFVFKDRIYEAIDWEAEYVYVIKAVIERTNEQDWTELIQYYGHDKVLDAVKNKVIGLWESDIERVCAYFHLGPEELHCYRRLQQRVTGIFD